MIFENQSVIIIKKNADLDLLIDLDTSNATMECIYIVFVTKFCYSSNPTPIQRGLKISYNTCSKHHLPPIFTANAIIATSSNAYIVISSRFLIT